MGIFKRFMWSIEAYWSGMVPKAKKTIRVILYCDRLFYLLLYNELYLRLSCWFDLSHVQHSSKDPCYSLACGHKRISGRRFSPPELGGFILVSMLLIVYAKIYATYKGHKCEGTLLLSGICSIHTAKEPANVLKKFKAEAKSSWISNILNKY